MNLSFFRLPENMTSRERNALLVIFLYTVGSLVTGSYLIFQAVQNPSWQLWTTAFSITAVFAACIVALFISRRGHFELGIWVLVIVGFAGSIGVVTAVSGLGLLFLTMLVAFNAMIAVEALKSRQAHLFIAGTTVGVIILFLDAYIPTERLNVPVFQNMVYFFVPTIILLLGIMIFRQFRNYTLRTKMIVLLVGVTLASISIIGFVSNYVSSTRINDQVGANLVEISSQLSSTIGGTLDTNIKMLSTLALDKTLQDNVEASNTSGVSNSAELNRLDQLWKKASDNDPLINGVVKNDLADDLREFQSKFPVFLEVFTTDKYGAITASTGRTSDYYQADEQWWQSAWNNGKGQAYIGQVIFDESTKASSIDIAIPITSHNGNMPIGVLRATIDVNEFSTFIQSFKIGKTGRSDLLFQNNQTLTAETGFDTLRPEDITSLATLSKTYGQISYEGSASLVSAVPISAPLSEQKDAIEQLGWKVIVHQDISEAQEGVTTTTRSIVFAAILLTLVIAVIALYFAQILAGPIVRLTQTAEKIAGGDITIQAKVEASDEIGALAGAFNRMTQQLRDFINTLESRVAERTQSLELAAEVGRTVSQVRALDVMLKDAAEIIRSQFNLYYVQVYLVDPSFTNLVLQAGTGEVGAQLVERGHSLPLNTNSINGRAAIEKRSGIVEDTATSLTFRSNPLLPDTRSEMAIPLLLGERVVGVLDLQSANAGVLSQDVLPAFEALAGQLAIAIQNSNLLAEAEQARTEVEKQARRLVRAGWRDYQDAIHKPEQTGYVFSQNQIMPLDENPASQWPEELSALTAPIAVSGEPLGLLSVGLELQEQSPQAAELVNIVARQVSQQIENLRLLESANRYRAEAEQASRLATIEGWKKYREERSADSLSYVYDLKEVKPYKSEDDQQLEEQTATLPLKVRDETIGKISITGIDPGDTESLSLANDVAERLSAHIESMRQFEETKRGQLELDQRARQLAAVAEVSTVSSRELDIQKMLESVVHLTQRRFGLYHCHVFLYDKRTDHLTIQACGWKEGDEHEGTHGTTSIPLTQEQSLVARAGRTLEVVMVNAVHNELGWLPNPLLPDTASEMAVPLVTGGQLLGILDVQSDRLNAFSMEDASIYTTLASQVATALQNAQSFARAQQQAERETKLNIISQKIQSATTVEAVLQIAARELGHALGAPRTIAQLSLKDKQ